MSINALENRLILQLGVFNDAPGMPPPDAGTYSVELILQKFGEGSAVSRPTFRAPNLGKMNSLSPLWTRYLNEFF